MPVEGSLLFDFTRPPMVRGLAPLNLSQPPPALPAPDACTSTHFETPACRSPNHSLAQIHVLTKYLIACCFSFLLMAGIKKLVYVQTKCFGAEV